MIPTEEMVDPDQESPEATSKGKTPAQPKPTLQERINARVAPAAQVTTSAKVPATQTPPQAQTAPAPVPKAAPAPADPVPPVLEYLAREREALRVVREITKAENNAIWKAQVKALTEAGLAPAKGLTEYTKQEAEKLISDMYARFDPKGTVLKDEGKIA